MTLNSNSEASLAWFHVGALLAVQLVDALRSTLTAALTVVIAP